MLTISNIGHVLVFIADKLDETHHHTPSFSISNTIILHLQHHQKPLLLIYPLLRYTQFKILGKNENCCLQRTVYMREDNDGEWIWMQVFNLIFFSCIPSSSLCQGQEQNSENQTLAFSSLLVVLNSCTSKRGWWVKIAKDIPLG